MQNINHQIQRIAERYKTYENISELKEDIQNLLLELSNKEEIESIKAVTLSDLVNDRLIEMFNHNANYELLIKTGFTDYDKVFGGILKGELVVIGARPGMGKSQFIINLCTNIAKAEIPCGFISLEFSAFLLANRFLSNVSGVSNHKIITKQFGQDEKNKLINSAETINNLPIYVHDKHISSISNILERCKQLVEENKVQIIFIDYLQLIGNYNRRYNRETELALITRELKKLTKELNVAIVVTSQLSRQVENRPGGSKRPQLSDLRESGAIEQDADKVLFLYRPEYYGLEVDENNEPTQGKVELIMAKNNTGYCESIKLAIKTGFTGFTDYKGPFSELTISQNRLNDLN